MDMQNDQLEPPVDRVGHPVKIVERHLTRLLDGGNVQAVGLRQMDIAAEQAGQQASILSFEGSVAMIRLKASGANRRGRN